MNVADVVDLGKFKYVCREPLRVDTKTVGNVWIPKGFLSDGSTGVPDLCPEAFFLHDLLYMRPIVGGIRHSKTSVDIAYAEVLLRHWQWWAAMYRPIGLSIVGWKSWREFRQNEKDDIDYWQQHFIAKKDCWYFPNYELKNAEWRGPRCRL